MITLWALVVVSDNSLSRAAVEQPVLLMVSAAFHRRGYAPYHHLQNRAVVENDPVALARWSNSAFMLAIMPTD
jgi:hypothetical protein